MTSSTTLTADQLYESMREEIEGRKRRGFAPALLIALIDFMEALGVPEQKLSGLDDFYTKFPVQTTTAHGRGANVLIVSKPSGGTDSIRPHYNKVETYIRHEQKRYDYPSAAPHATQAWKDYEHWIGALVTFDSETLAGLREEVVDYVLETFPSQAIDPSELVKEPPVFAIFLSEFDFRIKAKAKTKSKGKSKREPPGSGFQGAVFAYIRADSPHLQVEVRKTHTGGKRVAGVGDIDAWDGSRLVKTCEVKHFKVMAKDAAEYTAFAGEAAKRRADGYLVAEDFEDGAREAVEALGIHTMTLADLKRHVSVWDPLKQQNALQAFEYFITHREQNSSLALRFKQFCLEKGFRHAWSRPLVDDFGDQFGLLILDDAWKAG